MAATIDVAELIDRRNISPYQCVIALMAWLTLFLDGVDTQSMAYVAPALSKDWGLQRGALGSVFAVGVMGVALGALLVGPLADRYGRKAVAVATVLYVALFSFLVAQSAPIATLFPGMDKLSVLWGLRFLSGLGLGAAVPLGVVIANEFAPRRRRAAMVTLMGCGYAIGSALGGVVASKLVPAYGWQAQFYLACLLTLCLAAALVAFLPESIRFLTIRGMHDGVAKIFRRIYPELSFEASTKFVLRREPSEKSATQLRPLRLFLEGRAPTTTLVWLCLFVNLVALNYLNNWLPTLTFETGLPQGQALRAAAFLQFGGMLGIISMGFLADYFGFYRVIAAAFVGGGIFISLIGFAGGSFYPLSAIIFLAGFCNIGAQITIAALTATLYPTDIRATGVNWAHGVARMVSAASVATGGVLLARHWPLTAMYSLVAAPMFFGSVFILLLQNVRRAAREPVGESESRAVA
jgi:MFS transporter, AAHS family, 4-hydroxybenzoate transporter